MRAPDGGVVVLGARCKKLPDHLERVRGMANSYIEGEKGTDLPSIVRLCQDAGLVCLEIFLSFFFRQSREMQ